MRETSTNITRYLYSSHSPRPQEKLKTLASQNFGETKTLDNKSLISELKISRNTCIAYCISGIEKLLFSTYRQTLPSQTCKYQVSQSRPFAKSHGDPRTCSRNLNDLLRGNKQFVPLWCSAETKTRNSPCTRSPYIKVVHLRVKLICYRAKVKSDTPSLKLYYILIKSRLSVNKSKLYIL